MTYAYVNAIRSWNLFSSCLLFFPLRCDIYTWVSLNGERNVPHNSTLKLTWLGRVDNYRMVMSEARQTNPK